MTDRLEKIFSVLPKCEIFADVGCDHGYIAREMLYSGRCRRAIISDISEKCLNKARTLLEEYIEDGRAMAVLSNGFDKLPFCDLALIAGMGGQEIINILNSAKTLPKKLVLQPMKNADEVRRRVVELGYEIVLDRLFYSAKKFYNVISLEEGKDLLTDEEIEFGRTNILTLPNDFIEFVKIEKDKINRLLNNPDISSEIKGQLQSKLERLNKYA